MAGFRRLQHNWNALGERNALGAILTGSGGALSDWDLDRFLATGREDVARFESVLDELAPQIRKGRALDFGCGVGRVTRALAARFESVDGLDVAASMIQQ